MSRYRSSYWSSTDGQTRFTYCGCLSIIALVNVFLGTWSVNYLLMTFLNKTIPFIGALLIGLIAGEVTIPVAIIIWVLKIFGVM